MVQQLPGTAPQQQFPVMLLLRSPKKPASATQPRYSDASTSTVLSRSRWPPYTSPPSGVPRLVQRRVQVRLWPTSRSRLVGGPPVALEGASACRRRRVAERWSAHASAGAERNALEENPLDCRPTPRTTKTFKLRRRHPLTFSCWPPLNLILN